MYRKLTESECAAAIAAGEFSADLIAASPNVAVILTQSWCPQWGWMRSYLADVAAQPGFSVFWVEYDHEPFFEEFMSFKENVLGNREIPYVRYYRSGAFVRAGNYIDRAGFLRAFGR